MTNRKAFENYITQNVDGVYRFAYTYMRSREEAEDVVNDSVVKALKAVGSLRDPKQVSSWFLKIVANTALTRLRQSKRETVLDPTLIEDTPVHDDSLADLTFEQMLNVLDPHSRAILSLRFFEDRPLDEIAVILDENLNTVKTRLYRALKVLRVEMEGLQ